MGKSDRTPRDLFVRVLGLKPELAAILVTNGFTTLEEVAYVPIDEFRSVKELTEQQIQDWRARARRHLLVQIGDGTGDQDPLTVVAGKPRKPMSGGAAAKIDDDKSQ